MHRSHILICSGSNCSHRQSRAVRSRLRQAITETGLEREFKVIETGCFGLCQQGPIMVIYPEGVHYCRVQADDIDEIVQTHLQKGRVVTRLLFKSGTEQSVELPKTAFYQKQKRVVLRNVGLIDPENIEESLARDGYQGLAKVLDTLSPEAVIAEVTNSGLQGRGGAGFPAGRKWEFTRKAPGDQKYVVCNADEGEPGTSKDRLILEGDPHTIIEGMAIAGYAVGATKGFIYIRGEYQLSLQRFRQAVAQAKEYGLLGQDILGSGFHFDIEVRSGAGAYVCGEETALLNSLEGKRGEPRYKPPFPANFGLWGKPTLINNVETLANIGPILIHGADWYRSIGSPECPGTKVFTLSGNIANRGLIEVPMGITLREIVEDIGGGIPNGRHFKMAQTGGTSGGCLAVQHLDLPVDIPHLAEVGSSLGSGALLVVDDSHCMVDLARVFLKFFAHESCGQCTPCREGTTLLKRLVDKIASGSGTAADIKAMRRLSTTMQMTSLCGLGQTVPTPVLTMLAYFNDEFMEHLDGGACATGVCRAAVKGVV